MKELQIVAPEGYEVDKEKSTFEKIVFKAKTKTEMPKNWEEYCDSVICNPEYYIDEQSVIREYKAGYVRNPKCDKNLYATKDDAEAILALTQLRRIWQDFRDDFNGLNECPAYFGYDQEQHCWHVVSDYIGLPLWFNDWKTAQQFLKNYKELFDKIALLYE